MWPMAQERGWLLLSLTWDRKSKAGGQWVGTSDSFSLPPALPPVFRQREEELFVRQGVPRVATREPSKLSSQGRLPGGGVTRGPVSWRMVRKLRCSGEGGKQVTMCAEDLLPVWSWHLSPAFLQPFVREGTRPARCPWAGRRAAGPWPQAVCLQFIPQCILRAGWPSRERGWAGQSSFGTRETGANVGRQHRWAWVSLIRGAAGRIWVANGVGGAPPHGDVRGRHTPDREEAVQGLVSSCSGTRVWQGGS